jgi:hypothetical protein
MLSLYADPTFYEAQAVVLSKMGQHKQALEIYVFKMKDYQKAEQYVSADVSVLHILTSIDTVTELILLKTPLHHLNRTQRTMPGMILKRPHRLFTTLCYRSIFNHHRPINPTWNQHLTCSLSMDHASQQPQHWA